MKYAFIIGTNAFIVPSKAISYTDHEEDHVFLKINSIYHDLPSTAEPSFLDIDLDVKDMDGTRIGLSANEAVTDTPYAIQKQRDSIKILRTDGSTVIHVHQLDDDAAMALEHNIVAELEVHAPVVVIRINGNFIVGDIVVRAENEKLFINENGYATSAMIGKNQLVFTSEGVVL